MHTEEEYPTLAGSKSRARLLHSIALESMRRGRILLSIRLVNRLKFAAGERAHRFWVKQPFGKVTREIAGMPLAPSTVALQFHSAIRCGLMPARARNYWASAGLSADCRTAARNWLDDGTESDEENARLRRIGCQRLIDREAEVAD